MIPHEYNIYLRRKFSEFLEEDIGLGDITTEIVPRDIIAEAVIIAKEEGVIAGTEEVAELFRECGVEVLESISSGSKASPGDIIMRLRGPVRMILTCERTALNLLARMSGIATATAELVRRAKSVRRNVVVAGTRKGVPGFRYFEKRAIIAGGGDPHRLHLDDCILIKDNHIAVVGGVAEAIRRAKRIASFTKKIEVEVRSVEEALEAAREGADIIMLDNMKPEEIRVVVKRLEEEGLRDRILIEASGGIRPENVKAYVEAGIDIVSSGYITHSAPALDVSLEIVKCSPHDSFKRTSL